MHTSIVVPLDGSVFGSAALPVAIALARRSDAALHLVQVRDPAAAGPLGPESLGAAEPLRRAELEEFAAHLADEESLRVTAHFLDGPVVDTLQRYLEGSRHDLVVLMSHGRGGLSRAWLGSVADGLIRHAPVPLLLLRQDTPSIRDAVEPLFRRVIVPLDGSALAESVLDHVLALGTTDVTEYVILTVVAPHRERESPAHASDTCTARSHDEQQRGAALQYLNVVAADLRSTGAVVTVRVEAHQQTAQGILDAAAVHRADLIALSAHGRGSGSRLIHGSVADKVIRGATMAALVHHPSHVGREPFDASETAASAAGR